VSSLVSRVLSFKAVICLGVPLPARSSHPSKYLPSWQLLSMLHRVGFAWQCRYRHSGELLPRHSTLTAKAAVYFYALSRRSPSAAVSRYPAVWCSDFPHRAKRSATARAAHSMYFIIL